MKIHKLNLENYYRNVIDSAIAVLSNLPEAVFAGRPTFNNALLRFNDGEAPVLMLPKWSDITIDLSQHKPSWAPASLTGTIKVSITPSVVGVEASADETSLGSFDVYGVTGTSTGKQYSVNEGKYAIEYAVSILDGENNPVVVFSNGQALKVAMVKDADNGPDTTLDIPAGGGGSFTQEQADWNQSDDTAVDYIKNKPTIPAAQVNADWDATEGVAEILHKPTIPTVNDATLTFTQDGETLATFSANASTNVEVEIPAGGGGGGASIIETTWAALKALRDGGTLTPGQQYRITDYVATSAQASTWVTSHPFDIIVTAIDESNLSDECGAAKHSGDTYYPSTTDFGAWKIWYCLDNDTTRFNWAKNDSTGRGVIYRMIDEWNNDAPFDFKSIWYGGTIGGIWTSAFAFGSGTTDKSVDGSFHDNRIGPYYLIQSQPAKKCYSLPIIIVNGSNNVIEQNCNSIVLYDQYFNNPNINNHIEEGCSNMRFNGGFYDNKIGPGCENVKCGADCRYNVVGPYCRSLVMGDYCTNNVFDAGCYNVNFGSSSSNAKAWYTNVTVEAGNQYINLDCTGSTSSSSRYRNVTIAKGVNNTTTALTITDSNVGQTYQTTFFNETDGTLKKQEGTTITTVA